MDTILTDNYHRYKESIHIRSALHGGCLRDIGASGAPPLAASSASCTQLSTPGPPIWTWDDAVMPDAGINDIERLRRELDTLRAENTHA